LAPSIVDRLKKSRPIGNTQLKIKTIMVLATIMKKESAISITALQN